MFIKQVVIIPQYIIFQTYLTMQAIQELGRVQKAGEKDSQLLQQVQSQRQIAQIRRRLRWTQSQKRNYYYFVRRYKQILQYPLKKQKQRIYNKMSQSIGTRTTHQCRSHHQKVMHRFISIDKYVAQFQKQYGIPREKQATLIDKNQDQDFNKLKQQYLEEYGRVTENEKNEPEINIQKPQKVQIKRQEVDHQVKIQNIENQNTVIVQSLNNSNVIKNQILKKKSSAGPNSIKTQIKKEHLHEPIFNNSTILNQRFSNHTNPYLINHHPHPRYDLNHLRSYYPQLVPPHPDMYRTVNFPKVTSNQTYLQQQNYLKDYQRNHPQFANAPLLQLNKIQSQINYYEAALVHKKRQYQQILEYLIHSKNNIIQQKKPDLSKQNIEKRQRTQQFQKSSLLSSDQHLISSQNKLEGSNINNTDKATRKQTNNEADSKRL